MRSSYKVKSSGFTLIELLVVISIIGMMSSVILASLSSARMSAYHTKGALHIKQVQNALELYYLNNNGVYPGVNPSNPQLPTAFAIPSVAGLQTWTTLGTLLFPYLKTMPVPHNSSVIYGYYKSTPSYLMRIPIRDSVTSQNVGCVFITGEGYYLDFWWINNQSKLAASDGGIDLDGIEKWNGNVRFEKYPIVAPAVMTPCPVGVASWIPYP